MKKKISHKFIGFSLFLVSYILFLSFTNPASLPLGALLLPSLLLGFIVYFFIGMCQLILGFKESIATALSFSFLSILLSMLASLSQLTLRDIILSVLLISVFIFYFERSKE